MSVELWRPHYQPGGTWAFLPRDTEELYRANLRIQPPDWPWRSQSVTYTLNSQGFRSPEFDSVDWAASIVCFGCSLTLGIGVNDDQTWPHYLSEITGLPTVNLGQSGASCQLLWLNSWQLSRKGIEPRAVAYYWPEATRSLEFDQNYTVRQYGAWSLESPQAQRGEPGDLGQAWALQQDNALFWSRALSQSLPWSCPRAAFTWGDSFGSVPHLYPRFDWARDLGHIGPESLWVVAQNMASCLRI